MVADTSIANTVAVVLNSASGPGGTSPAADSTLDRTTPGAGFESTSAAAVSDGCAAATPSDSLAEAPIVFFDGVCGFCNASVNQLLRWDRHGVLRFAPLQGETATELLSAEQRTDLKSLVLLAGGRTWVRSAAVVQILLRLPGWPALLGRLLWCVPLPLRDLGYRIVARFRYRIFGRRETCRMPSPAERGRFLP
jgi:predicted DCC family thiol-disulfide oxidoreductase YuxK